jgi:3-oxoadipate enol-lactonase
MPNSLFVEDFGGNGQVLILVHGLGGSTNTWYPQSQVLKRDFRVVAYDLTGSGRSPVKTGIPIESHVSDLLDVIRQTGGQHVHLAGHSMGTIICQHLSAAHPDMVHSLALVGPFPEPAPPARDALKARAAKARKEGLREIANAIVDAGTSSDTKINQPAAAAFVRESIMAQSAEGYASNCDALAVASRADLSRIACPVLLLTGDQDRSAPPDVGRAMASSISIAEMQVLAGCGHWATIERAKQVSYAMTMFYAKMRRTSKG